MSVEAPLLEVRNVSKTYKQHRMTVQAVTDVTLTLAAGESLGIVGESGCGKSTLARMIVRLDKPSSGRIDVRGNDVWGMRGKKLKKLRREVQIVFQDPYSSLNPRMTAGDIIGEALALHPELAVGDRTARVHELLATVGLTPAHAARYPHQFSGGQRQRIGIARALAVDPSLLVLDEPVSALDVSVQAQVINLLEDLRATLGVAYVMISHDLSVVGHTCDRVAVMYLGRIVETGPTEQIFTSPRHPYTKALLSAVPAADWGEGGERIVLQGDVGDPARPPSGCRFRERCWKATEKCATETPELQPADAAGASYACHYPL
ncbi:ATP-binding cassette domain-containing protein [Microbacterium lushaniae]|nr:ATP-binding cassette domain-containing protein [Microbacterium lushaniae]KAA9159862.1 ATP-binding cassette domain-containing protein [Microbacterium lushaniae]